MAKISSGVSVHLRQVASRGEISVIFIEILLHDYLKLFKSTEFHISVFAHQKISGCSMQVSHSS